MRKARFFLLILLVPALLQVSCKKDEDKPELPVLVTSVISNISQDIATCGGNISSDGGTQVIARGVCWNTTANPTISNNLSNDGTGIGTFESSITGLMPSTMYYVRAYATNSVGTVYGNELSFTTLAETLGYKAPSSAARTEFVPIPAGLEAKSGTDQGASMAVIYMGLANAFGTMGGSFLIPDEAQLQGKKDGSRVYFWSGFGLSYWMTYTELVDKYTWKYEWEYTGQPRFTYIYAEEAINGKSGNWSIFNPEDSQANLWTYDWSINSINTFTGNLVFGEGDDMTKFETIANANNSGTFKYFVGTVLNALIVWNSDGTGSYTFYSGLEMYNGVW